MSEGNGEQDLKSAGFTLLEILVVLSIVALTMAVAVPNFIKSTPRSAEILASEAKELLELARLSAISGGTETLVVINLDQRTLTGDNPKRSIVIPDGISASATVGRDTRTTINVGTIHFYPDGSSTGGMFRFAANGEMASIVTINWLTGSIVGRHE